MSKGSIAVLFYWLLLLHRPPSMPGRTPTTAISYSRHARTPPTCRRLRRYSMTCLTSAARSLLGRIRAHFGNVEIVSTCRPGASHRRHQNTSKHASGQAIDFRVPGKKAEVVRWLIANHHTGGVMTYSDMDHIHVDVGPRFVALNRPSGRT